MVHSAVLNGRLQVEKRKLLVPIDICLMTQHCDLDLGKFNVNCIDTVNERDLCHAQFNHFTR